MNQNEVWVIGHKNPDTDSICAAIAYANLKNKLKGDSNNIKYIPKRAGNINGETQYVLDYFHMEKPELAEDAGAQIQDIEIRKTEGVSRHISIKKAWEMMKERDVVSLAITNSLNKLVGMIVTGDIATTYMDVYDNRILSRARTQYKNIMETVNGTMFCGNSHSYFLNGKVVMAASSKNILEDYVERDDLVIIGDRKDVQKFAIEKGASCLVISCSGMISREVLDLAKENDCVIISTEYDAFTVARLIHQSMPIKYVMKTEDLITFDLDDFVEEVKEVMSKVRHRDFPVLTEDGKFAGMISRRNLLNMKRKQIILVDHNEKTQAITNIENAEILEIIDHHRLGSLETISPVYFRNQPLGCTSTIVAIMYQEHGIQISKQMAGIMLAAIISDTLMFRSPTCTDKDKEIATRLAEIGKIDIKELAKKMFQAGANFSDKSTEEILYQDYKVFHLEQGTIAVAQVSAVSGPELDKVGKRIREILQNTMIEQNLQMIFVMLTDILEESTKVIFEGQGAKELLEVSFQEFDDDVIELKGIVSRKKQFIPGIMNGMMKMEESN